MPTIEKHELGVPSWYDLMSPDLAKAHAFYTGLFGWQFATGGPETGGYSMAQIGGKNVCGMGPIPPGAPFPSAWTVYFNVASVDATVATVLEHGGKAMMPGMDVLDVGRMGICVDPTGAVFGLWQAKTHRGADLYDQHGAMTWQDLHTRDAATACEFYARVFDLVANKLPGDGPMAYWTLNRGELHAAGIAQSSMLPEGVPNHWQPYFAVDDADAAAAKAAATGGKVVYPCMDTPYGRIAVLADPFGAVFCVCKLPAK